MHAQGRIDVQQFAGRVDAGDVGACDDAPWLVEDRIQVHLTPDPFDDVADELRKFLVQPGVVRDSELITFRCAGGSPGV